MTCPHHNQKANEPLRGLLEVDFDDEVAAKFRESLDIFDILPVEREFFPMIP
ncbi:MAG: pyridoxal-5'-phosphate-dependent protein subunit beta, partial [Candidatus Hydrothermota bacterium]